jgi:NADH-quinone oxidoreductase subunit N
VIVATLLIGNITAVFQQSVKRMLAYSSIAQAGFMLFALYAETILPKKEFFCTHQPIASLPSVFSLY